MARDYPLDVQNVGGDEYAFMSKGHHDRDAFMAEVAQWHTGTPMRVPKHLWVKTVPCQCGEHRCHYELSDEQRKGWFPATYTWETYGDDAYKPPVTDGVSVPSGKTFSQEDADGGKKG